MREGPFQHRPGSRFDVFRNATQIGAATAKQQAVIWGQAEIVGDELVIDHAAVAWQQRLGQRWVQGRGGHLVRADWQQASREMSVELVDVGIAGQHQHVAAYFAVLGAGDKAVGGLTVIKYAGLFEQAPAGCFEGGGQALGQFQRVEVATFRVVERSLVAWAVDPLGQRLTIDQLQFVVAPLFAGLALSLTQHTDPSRQYRSPQAARPVVDIEAMARGEFTQFLSRPAHAVPQASGPLKAEGFFQRRHVARPAQQRLSAIAPGCGPRHAAGLQHRYPFASQGQTQGGVQTTETGTNNQYFCVQTLVQGRAQRDRTGVGAGIVAGDMLGGLLEHGESREFLLVYFHEKLPDKFHDTKPGVFYRRRAFHTNSTRA
ncbi:hypothetical protein D3C77_82970 [compost metagenome]